MGTYFPMMVNVSGQRCVVIGGGEVAERKIQAFLNAGITVAAVSPEFTPTIRNWIDAGKVAGECRPYRTGDTADAFVVIAATNRQDVNEQVYRDSAGHVPWLDIADRPDLSTFSMPAVVRRGKLVIAVSTSGASPALASLIRRDLEEQYGTEYELYLDFLQEYRMKARQNVKDASERRALLRRVLETDGLAMIREGRFAEYRRRMLEQIERPAGSAANTDGGS